MPHHRRATSSLPLSGACSNNSSKLPTGRKQDHGLPWIDREKETQKQDSRGFRSTRISESSRLAVYFGLAHFDAPADADTDTTHTRTREVERRALHSRTAHCNFSQPKKTENHGRFRSSAGRATEHNAERSQSDNALELKTSGISQEQENWE